MRRIALRLVQEIRASTADFIIIQQASKVAEAIGVSQQTLAGWMEGKGEPTSKQAEAILEFLQQSTKRG